MMQQLDLFGAPQQQVKKDQPKVDASKEKKVAESTSEKAADPVTAPEAYELKRPSVIFENEKISVRIKEKVEEEKTPEEIPEQTSAVETSTGKRGRRSFKEMDAEVIHVEVPADEELFSKQYYPISQVAKWFNVNASLIRFWENEFDILKPRKNRKGDRLFRPEDVKNLQIIYHLLRHKKYTIEGAKEYLKQNKGKADANMQLIQALTNFKTFLLELRANLG